MLLFSVDCLNTEPHDGVIMSDELKTLPLTGLWVGSDGTVHLSFANIDGTRSERSQKLEAFLWGNKPASHASRVLKLKGDGLDYLNFFDDLNNYRSSLSLKSSPLEVVRMLEHQYLLQYELRLFSGLHLRDLRRMQCDIETSCSKKGSFSNARRAGDRVLAIGLRMNKKDEILSIDEISDDGEQRLLLLFNERIKKSDPDIIEGHNIFKFDLEYLRLRFQRYKIPCEWGRFGQKATFRNSRYKVAERWVDYPRCDIPGRTVFDTYLMIQQYDVTKRELESYSLKSIARHLGISKKESRTYLSGGEIQVAFEKDRSLFNAYLKDDLRETAGVADFLLPTYFAQAQNFPMTFQEIILRGSSSKVELLFQEKYFHAKQALPQPLSIGQIPGGFTKSFEEGVFNDVLHFDVASLYPSLLLAKNKNPKNDSLKCFIPLLKSLRHYRLEYKKKARDESDPELKREYDARQSAYKILINSFYGYLGFEGARFADSELAAEITAQGRKLLQSLIEKFQELGCVVLEADTDGIYLASDKYFKNPEELLTLVSVIMPKGVDLEYDGSYEAMFCYKAKNYALREGDRIIIRGSSLRSRATEPFLRDLTNSLIHHLLGFEGGDPNELKESYKKQIELSQMDVKQLAKSERLSQNPEKYAEDIEGGKKPRRASLEVALRQDPKPKMGDVVTYYIASGEKAKMPDWQVAMPIDRYDVLTCPYDPTYYLKKIKEWEKKYGAFMVK